MTDRYLSSFLINIANSIDSLELSQDKIEKVREFYKAYNNKVDKEEVNNEFSSSDIKKFLIMGWYVYTMIGDTNDVDKIEEID